MTTTIDDEPSKPEADVVINGHRLTIAQSLALRSGVAHFLAVLADSPDDRVAELYGNRIAEVLAFMLEPPA